MYNKACGSAGLCAGLYAKEGIAMEKAKAGSRFFQNRDCEYFPCHTGIPEDELNCLFCFCPLYTLGRKCGGNCTYTETNIKSCQNCTFPHRRENYETVIGRFDEIHEVVMRSDRIET